LFVVVLLFDTGCNRFVGANALVADVLDVLFDAVLDVELDELPGCDSVGYHPLLFRNGYQPLSSAKAAHIGTDNITNIAIAFRKFIIKPIS
jgi:hypothetical protein